jgi:hypothetical protein
MAGVSQFAALFCRGRCQAKRWHGDKVTDYQGEKGYAGRFELADLADRLTQALEARQKVINARPVQVIEHEPKADAGLPAEVPDHSMVIPPISRGGFGKRRF